MKLFIGHTVGLPKSEEESAMEERKLLERNFQANHPALLAAFVRNDNTDKLKMEEVQNFSVANLSRDSALELEHRPTTSSAYQTAVEPSTSFSNNITLTSNNITLASANSFSVSEGYTYQSYGWVRFFFKINPFCFIWNYFSDRTMFLIFVYVSW